MPEIHIRAEEILTIGPFPVTNSLLASFLISGLMVAATFFMRKKMAFIPGKIQNFFEMIVEDILKLMDSVLTDRKLSEKYLPLVATIFLFVLASNWLGLIPGVGAVGFKENGVLKAFLRPPSSDLNFTIALAAIAVFGVNFFAVLALGFKKHFSKFFTLRNPIFSFVGLIEFASEFIKIISFSFRLFGNIFAGKVLLLIVGFLVPYFIPLPFLFLEIFIGFIQAFIFAILTLVFIAMAVQPESAH
ncbi:MAG: F-type H+-transporting ATPase subunit a [Parcubacteria group bacterium Gr01-1014_30]|nr:MAG: F-type H+-transporting ATPase subunit a [Parcubacteria group bacterium Gr01-1014_30]